MPTLEEQLGVRLSVWVGAIALTLAGVFLVKYAFDHDWLGPGADHNPGSTIWTWAASSC